MLMGIFLLAVLLAGCSFAGKTGAESGYLVYESWPPSEEGGLVISQPPPDILEGSFSWGDAFTPAFFCPPTSRFVCFKTDRYAFAYPKDRKAGERSWTHEGVRFEIVREDFKTYFLGKPLDGVMLIKQPKDSTVLAAHFGTEYFYLYSPSVGIIAFGNEKCHAGRYVEFYWLVHEKGFGVIGDLAGR